MKQEATITKIFLVILDGWGWTPVEHGNLLFETPTPGIDTLLSLGKATLLRTAGLEGGLPWGAVGDSELGHYNLGTGRIVVRRTTHHQTALVSVDSRQILMDDNPDTPNDHWQALANENYLTVPTSLAGLLLGHGYTVGAAAIPQKLPLILKTMNGYPTKALAEEFALELQDETQLETELESHPDFFDHDLLILNLSLPDRMAHTGDLLKLREAIQTTDRNLQILTHLALEQQAILYLTSDHGNIEQMLDINQHLDPQHTTSPVALIRIDFHRRRQLPTWAVHHKPKRALSVTLPTGLLADVTPTLLDEFNVPKPDTMVGISLRRTLA